MTLKNLSLHRMTFHYLSQFPHYCRIFKKCSQIYRIILSYPLADWFEYKFCLVGRFLCSQNINKYLNKPFKEYERIIPRFVVTLQKIYDRIKLDKANIRQGQSMNFFQTLKQSQRPVKIYVLHSVAKLRVRHIQ